MLIFGGGLVKHHICNANLMRNGANYAVFVNTGHEFDGSDSGAKPDEAVSWGKVRAAAARLLSRDATYTHDAVLTTVCVVRAPRRCGSMRGRSRYMPMRPSSCRCLSRRPSPGSRELRSVSYGT